MTFVFKFSGEEDRLNLTAIHQDAVMVANAKYHENYGVDIRSDPEFKAGGVRHHFWLAAFDKRSASLMLNPEQ